MAGIQLNVLVLDQLEKLLRQFDARSFSGSLQVLNGSSPGQHVRHILDFYDCLFRGLEAGWIDYGARERRAELEERPDAALHALYQFQEALEGLDPGRKVFVVSPGKRIRHGDKMKVESSLGRELLHVHDHTVHHLAILRMAIQAAFPQWEVDPDLGIAPSTLAYREQGRCSPATK